MRQRDLCSHCWAHVPDGTGHVVKGMWGHREYALIVCDACWQAGKRGPVEKKKGGTAG